MEIDPYSALAGTRETAEPSASELGREDFLRMLIAQLENQDPLNPQESTEFTAQLATFSSLEQLVSMRSAMEAMTAASERTERTSAIELVGREVQAESELFELKDGPVDLLFEQLGDSTRTSVVVTDSQGAVVYEEALGPLSSGLHRVEWDGSDRPEGVYQLEVRAWADEEPLESRPLIEGSVTHANFEQNAASLHIGEIAIPLGRLRQVAGSGLPVAEIPNANDNPQDPADAGSQQ